MGEHARILVVSAAYVPGLTAGTKIRSMTRALRGAVDVVCLKASSQAHQGRMGKARIFRVKRSGEGSFERAVLRQIASESYDLIHVLGTRPLLEIRAASPRTLLVYEPEALELDSDWEKRHEAAIRAADLVIVPTRMGMKATRSSSTQIRHLPPGVDVDAFDWQPHYAGSQTCRGLYLGRIDGPSNVRELLLALALLRDGTSPMPIEFMIAGDPDPQKRAALRDYIDDLELGESVQVRGLPNPRGIAQLIGGTHFGVVADSQHAAFTKYGLLPQPLLEYWASHRPIVAPDWSSIRELVPTGEGVAAFTFGDMDSLRNAIHRVGPKVQQNTSGRTTERTNEAYRRIRRDNAVSARERLLREIYEELAPGSQLVDPWDEAFDEENTDVHPIESEHASIEGETTHVDGGAPLTESGTHPT